MLDSYYTELLKVGFLILRQAIESNDQSWVDAELEMLHNIPSLLGEENIERHRYFWFKERTHYIELITSSANDDARSRMRTYYEPIWDEMESSVLQALAGNRCEGAEHFRSSASSEVGQAVPDDD